MPTWKPTGPAQRWTADVSSQQCGDYWDVAYQDTDLSAQVTVYWYAVKHADDTYDVEQQTEMIIAGDLSDPGGTEQYADYAYDRVAYGYPTPAAALDFARQLAERHSASDITWDGQPPWGR